MGKKVKCDICGGVPKSKGARMFSVREGEACSECIEGAGLSVNGATKKEFIARSVSELRRLKTHREENKEQIQRDFEANRDAFNVSVSISPQNNVPECPKCGCTSISADKKGFGVGKAVIGTALAGPIGLVAGNIGAKKVRVTCLNCGHQWTKG